MLGFNSLNLWGWLANYVTEENVGGGGPFLLLADGSSKLLLANGTDRLLIVGHAPSSYVPTYYFLGF